MGSLIIFVKDCGYKVVRLSWDRFIKKDRGNRRHAANVARRHRTTVVEWLYLETHQYKLLEAGYRQLNFFRKGLGK